MIQSAADEGFEILLTVDKNINYQQNSGNLKIVIVVFNVLRNKMEYLTPLIPKFKEKIKVFEKETYIKFNNIFLSL